MKTALKVMILSLITSWAIISLAQENERKIPYLDAMVVSRDEPQTLYIGTHRGFGKLTVDEKKARMEILAMEGIPVTELIMVPDEEAFYVGTFCCGAAKVEERKGKYKVTPLKLTGNLVYSMVWASGYGLVFATEQGIFQSRDRGETVVDISEGLPVGIEVQQLLYDPEFAEYILLKTQDSLWLYSEKNKKWTNFKEAYNPQVPSAGSGQNFRVVTYIPYEAPGMIYFATPVVCRASVSSFIRVRDSVLAGTRCCGVKRITSEGKGVWRGEDLKMEEEPIFSLAKDAHDLNLIYAGTRKGMFRTTDRGESWELVDVEMAAE